MQVITLVALLALGTKADKALSKDRSALYSQANLCRVYQDTVLTYAQAGNVQKSTEMDAQVDACIKGLIEKRDAYVRKCAPLLDQFTCEKQAREIIASAGWK